jgi:antitoxin VapB
MPLRMSVWPVAIRMRALEESGSSTLRNPRHPRRGGCVDAAMKPIRVVKAQALDICQGICQTLMMSERHVKLFKNGRNQAVRIPREFELPGEDAIIRKEGQRLIIEAAPPRSLLAVLATLQTIDENFPPIEDLPADPVDL